MMNVIRWELLRRKMFTIWWTIGVVGLVALTVLSYISVKGQAQELDKALGNLSASVGSFFGGNDLFSPIGYLSSQIYYVTLPILLIIMILTLVSSLMSKDESDMTVELTLSRPISRSKLMSSKALAGLIIIGIIALISYVTTAICVSIAGIDISQTNLLITHLLTFAFSASFGAVAFAMIAASRFTRKIAGVVAIMLSFGGYILSSLAGMVDGLKFTAKLFPYHYFDTVGLLNGTINKGLIIYLVGCFALVGFISWLGYSRRDIG
jgi:ABC-2 type transport system permease protein